MTSSCSWRPSQLVSLGRCKRPPVSALLAVASRMMTSAALCFCRCSGLSCAKPSTTASTWQQYEWPSRRRRCSRCYHWCRRLRLRAAAALLLLTVAGNRLTSPPWLARRRSGWRQQLGERCCRTLARWQRQGAVTAVAAAASPTPCRCRAQSEIFCACCARRRTRPTRSTASSRFSLCRRRQGWRLGPERQGHRGQRCRCRRPRLRGLPGCRRQSAVWKSSGNSSKSLLLCS